MATSDSTVQRFIALAQDYCEAIESVETMSVGAAIDRLLVSLAKLMATALELPDIKPSSDDVPSFIDHETWFARFSALNRTLGTAGSYWTVLDASDAETPKPVLLPVADDLADIWRDLKNPLLALEAGGTLEDSVWEWRFSLDTHWGKHAVEAIRALHHASA